MNDEKAQTKSLSPNNSFLRNELLHLLAILWNKANQ